MISKLYHLRSRKPINYKDESSSSDEIEYFDVDNTNMSELQSVLTQMEVLQREIETLRLQSRHAEEGVRTNLQKVHIPKFNKINPHLWFAQIERSFAMHNITSDNDRFDLISVHLEDDILLSIEDLITSPPQGNKFDTLKDRLIVKFAESSESKLRRLLQGGETAGLKPSEILEHMKRLAPGKSNEPIIRTIFLTQMPETIRPLLTVLEEADLNKLAAMADKMLDATNNSIVCSVSPTSIRTSTQPTVDAVNHQMTLTEVCQAIKILSDKVEKMQSSRNLYHRQRSKSRSRSHSNVSTPDSQLCWYHVKFGDAAKHCKPNCPRFNSNSEN